MRTPAIFVFVLLIATSAAADQKTRFELLQGKSGGVFTWRSHTFDRDSDQLVPKNDYVIEDRKAGFVSVCLEWETAPNTSDGTFLSAFGSWHIPVSALKGKTLFLSVAKRSADSIVFQLSTAKGTVLAKSEPFPISKGWAGSIDHLAEHLSPVMPR